MSASGPSDSWEILPIGINGEIFRQRAGDSLSGLPSWTIVNLSGKTDEIHALVSKFVLKLVSDLPDLDLGGQTLASLLDTPQGNHWWWVQTSEKNPTRDPLVGQLYRLAIVRSVTESSDYDEIWISLEETALRKVVIRSQETIGNLQVLPCTDQGPKWWWDRHPLIRYWVHVTARLASFLAIRLLLFLVRWRSAAPTRGGVFFHTMYPYWWLDAFSEDATERFFSALPKNSPYQFAAWFVWPYRLWKNRTTAGRVVQSHRLIALQAFVTLQEAFRLLAISRFWRVVRFQRHMRKHVSVEFLSFQVGDLIGDDLARSLTGSEMPLDELVSCAVRNFGLEIQPRALIYRMELQTIENGLLFGARGITETIGFQYDPVVDNFLPLWFEIGELARSAGSGTLVSGRPMPEGILVCGGGSNRRLISYGYPGGRIARCGPQRHRRLLARRNRVESRAELRQQLDLPEDDPVLLIALALVESETAALFSALIEVCKELPNVRLVVKTHPTKLIPEQALIDGMSELGPDRAVLMPDGADVYEYIPAADAMICIGSIIAFDALVQGVMPVVFEDHATFAGSSLASYDRAMFIVQDVVELRSAIAHILTGSQTFKKKKECWPDLLDETFGDLDTPLFEQLKDGLYELGISLD